MAADLERFLALLASQHQNKPKLEAALSAAIEPVVENADLSATIPALFDLDLAVGDQLDKTGEWVGVTRYLQVPLTGVYFSFDTDGLGFDEGVWKGPTDPSTGLVALPDEAYRLLLRVRILNNQWDGSIDGAYEIWDTLFEGTGLVVFIEDHGDLTMSLGLLGSPDALSKAMFLNGLLNVKPAGVRMKSLLFGEPPLFAFDIDNEYFAGFDEGSWAEVTHPA